MASLGCVALHYNKQKKEKGLISKENTDCCVGGDKIFRVCLVSEFSRFLFVEYWEE